MKFRLALSLKIIFLAQAVIVCYLSTYMLSKNVGNRVKKNSEIYRFSVHESEKTTRSLVEEDVPHRLFKGSEAIENDSVVTEEEGDLYRDAFTSKFITCVTLCQCKVKKYSTRLI